MRNKIPKVGDKIYHDGVEFIVVEVKISTDPISGSRIVNVKQIRSLFRDL